MAAAVLSPPSIHATNIVLPPSNLIQHSPRHGRSRGASFKGKARYNAVEDPDTTLYKALMFVLKRAAQENELEEDADQEDAEILICDAEGWVDLEDVLAHPRIQSLTPSLSAVQRVVAAKSRLYLKQIPSSDGADSSSYEIRYLSNRDSASLQPVVEPGAPLETLSLSSENLPSFVVYETTYHGYPLILAAGAIKKASGSALLTFTAVSVDEKGNMTPAVDAEVGIWVDLKAAMTANPEMVWQRTEQGQIVNAAEEIPSSLWVKAVARRADIGVLYEDGEVRKEIPAGLRGKGGKGKMKKGKGSLKSAGKAESEESASEEGEAVEEEEQE